MKSRYEKRGFACKFNHLRELSGDTPRLIDQILTILTLADLQGLTIIEMGAGTGVMSREFSKRGARVLGFDSSD